MQPAFRISGHGPISITLNGVTAGQAALLHALLQASNSGAGFHPAPSFSPAPVLCGTADQLRCASQHIASQSDFPAEISKKIESLLDNYLRSDYKIICRGRVLELGSRTHLMGILNVTPDSFSDGGHYATMENALQHARALVAAGADILDIGGESTRPGAQPVPEAEELSRIIPLIERLTVELDVPVSVDTYKAPVARAALEAGASMVNDISGLRFSPDMATVAAEYNAAVLIMHSKGTPRDMQQNPVYDDVVGEVLSFLAEGIELAVEAGVDREKILVDPGIGFGKTLEHNLTLLRRLDEFRGLGRPIVLGASRKKFIGTVLGIDDPKQREDGTAATVALGIERGAAIVRVHDVARMAQVARMTDAVLKSKR